MALSRAGVPWQVAIEMSHEMREACLIVDGERPETGIKFDWRTMGWVARGAS